LVAVAQESGWQTKENRTRMRLRFIDAARSAAQAGTLVHLHERKDQTVTL
jgi:hypothetical protein